ncbi:unnamed protein product, partial [Mesorhabditis belari]
MAESSPECLDDVFFSNGNSPREKRGRRAVRWMSVREKPTTEPPPDEINGRMRKGHRRLKRTGTAPAGTG